MTNEVNATSRPAPYGGFHGLIRKVHKAAYEPVCANGEPIVFPTAHEAELAAWRALKAHLCGEIVGSGHKASAANFDEIRKVFPGHGKRPFAVERVKR